MEDTKDKAMRQMFAALHKDREACRKGDHKEIIAAIYEANEALERLTQFMPGAEATRLYYSYMLDLFQR